MTGMRYGFVLPGTAAEQLEQAVLAAMATRATRVRLGTMLTPLPWRRPWKVASQAATLDQLSGGRAILSVGLGAVTTGQGNTGEETDRRARAERLDEGIDLVAGLWAGRRRFRGRHYRMDLEAREDLSVVATRCSGPASPSGSSAPGRDRARCGGRCAATASCPPERMRQTRQRLEAGPPRP
jgi:alkanesulfonate monooxygenase SsuD/methylene tetrahydromethanopterin reductase-like flavin-dependent oxidoreductase (luciferase family)